MKTSDNLSGSTPAPPHSVAPRKRFALTGRSNAFDPLTDAVRPDIADIRLADRFFAPHYAAPVTRAVATPVALTSDREGLEPIAELRPGDTFEAIEIASDFAWGTVRPAGKVGYVKLAALQTI